MKTVNYKVPNGKLLKLNLKLKKGKIEEIKIEGDFFIHPEEKIKQIEKSLKGIKVNEVEETIERLIKEEEIKIIGFSPNDLEKAISSQMN
ncbi:MAG: lipoate protein ligase C-terminal domain-containing protein [archaeon]